MFFDCSGQACRIHSLTFSMFRCHFIGTVSFLF